MRVVMISQVFVPDPAAVGQQFADAAAELAHRGHDVRVVAAERGYDDPTRRYARREHRDGYDVRRVRWASFGKRSMGARLLGAASFTLQAAWQALRARPDVIVVSTSPPFAAAAALAGSWLTGARLVHWVMDLNPDQAIAMGVVEPRSLPARALDMLNRAVLRRASAVVVLDRFMAARVRAKYDPGARLSIIPPWPHETHLHAPTDSGAADAGARFRAEHGLTDKFVVMYSGNHTNANPLDTLLAAAERMREDRDVAFVFVGGGAAKRDVDAARARAPGVVSLPYQPMDTLGESLAAADVHVVTMGDRLAGIVHPCKVYGAMAVARPVLLFGPEASHVNDMIAEHGVGWRAAHGDVDGAVALIRALRGTARAALRARGDAGRALVTARLSQAALCGSFCEVVERAGATAAADRGPRTAPPVTSAVR